MAKHTNQQHRTKPTAIGPKPAAAPKQSRANGPYKLRTHLFIIAGLAIATWLILAVCLDGQLGLWDDTPYVKEDWLVKNISWEGIKNIFSTPWMGNYHPLTILSFAIEYSFVQLEPWLYHFDNLLLHTAIVALVYCFTLLLSRRVVAAIVVALLFGLHPMHMESVAWVAARKDLLCALFYFGACISYIYYRHAQSRKWIWYALVMALFLCSLLSKAVAVTLPLTLLLTDYLEDKAITRRTLIEKLPHFVLALAFGIIAIKAQHVAGAMEANKLTYNPIERIALGCYALTTYLWKSVIPLQLHCLYPYPNKPGTSLPYIYYIYPIIIAMLLYVAWRLLRKNKVAVFGLLFFIANILLVLQFLPVGDAIIAERYTYIPYFGLFFIAGYYVSGFFETGANLRYRTIVSCIALVYIGLLAYSSSQRCAIWHDDISLWRDETEKEPETAVRAFNNVAYSYYTKWMATNDPDEKRKFYDSTKYFSEKAILLQPDLANPYLTLGSLERSSGDYEAAKKLYFTALQRNPKEGNLYFELAIVHYLTKNMDSAGYYFKKVLTFAPSASAYDNYANYLTAVDKDDSALMEYNKAVSMTTDDYIPYMNRGTLYKKMNKWDSALSDYQKALKINPDAGKLYYLRSFCDTQQKNKVQAIADIEKAISLGYREVDMSYYNSLKSK